MKFKACRRHPHYRPIRAPRTVDHHTCSCRTIWKEHTKKTQAKAEKAGRKSPGGRPKGKSNVPLGTVGLMRAVQKAVDEYGEDDPIAQAAIQKMVDVMDGSCRHRWMGFEMSAARELLDRRLGRPKESIHQTGEQKVIVEIREVSMDEDEDENT